MPQPSIRQRLREVSQPAPSRPPSAARILAEVMVLFAVAVAYLLTGRVSQGRQRDAILHARIILALEGRAHVQIESAFQHFGLQHPWLLQSATLFYLAVPLPAWIAISAWLYWRHPAAYIWFRNTFLLSSGVGFVISLVLPVAPPRFLPGFVDILARSGLGLDTSVIGPFYNPYGAMPSLHVGWALLAGGALLLCGRPWWLRMVGGALPALMFMVVLTTGNHYLLDAVAGAALVLGSLWLSAVWPDASTPRALLLMFLPSSEKHEGGKPC